jgi:hypothetical protein
MAASNMDAGNNERVQHDAVVTRLALLLPAFRTAVRNVAGVG